MKALLPHRSPPGSKLPSYTYSDLPSADFIRLVELKPAAALTNSGISISLSAIKLDKLTTFDALSYTWGNPLTPFSEPLDTGRILDDVRRYPITVDGCSLLITANLMDALEVLRTSVIQVEGGKSRHIWIDSICINQNNLAERAAQVALMGSIYETAKNVFVWSGKEDKATKDAFQLIKILSRIPRQRHSEVKLADWYDQQRTLARFGIFDFLTPHMWCGLTVFLNRPLFSRVWIVQEVTLAKNPLLICGKKTLAWSMVSDVVAFLTSTGWHDQLSADYMRINGELEKRPGHYRQFLQSHAGVGMAAMYLEGTRAGVAATGHKALMRYLLQVHRFCKSTDPRDMIYALLGVAWQERPPFSTHAGAIVPDYTLTVQELYKNVAQVMLQSYQDLRFLSHKEVSNLTSIQNLPSWVPDYSVELRPAPLTIRYPTWKAAGELRWEGHQSIALNSSQLPVAGLLLDRIADIVTVTPPSDEFRETAATDPYWLEVFRVAKAIQPKSGAQSNFDIFSRTIFADTYTGHHPASASLAHTFFDYMIRALARIYVFEEVQSPDLHNSSTHVRRWIDMTLGWREMLKKELANSPFRIEVFEDQFAAAIERELASGPDPQYRTLFSGLEQEMRYTQNCRRLFCTQAGYFGCGAQSLEKGDEVWILGGADTPMLLRKLPSGGYRLIGETYVHGIMHGEAVVSKKQDQLRKILLQ